MAPHACGRSVKFILDETVDVTFPIRYPLLVIDAGNTRVKFGLFDEPDRSGSILPVCRRGTAVACGEDVSRDQVLGDAVAVRQAFITGSNPREVERLQREWPHDWPAPVVLADRSRFPLVIDVDFPDKVGIDRLLNAVAANVVRRENQPAIVIDSGTATTVDYVNARGDFCGGAILPGFDLCAKALHQYTALLPLVPQSTVDAPHPPERGRNTQAAITSGLYWGHVGAVKELLQRFTASDTAGTEPLVLLTGGAAPLLAPHLPKVRYEPHLSLQGLAIVGGASLACLST